MKSGVVITGTGAILVLTACDSFDNPEVVDALLEKGIDKYIAFEVPLNLVESQYGQHYQLVLRDRKQSDILRVVDVDGSRVFRNFSLNAFGQLVCHEFPGLIQRAA